MAGSKEIFNIRQEPDGRLSGFFRLDGKAGVGYFGVDLEQCADTILAGVNRDAGEVAIQSVERGGDFLLPLTLLSCDELEQLVEMLNEKDGGNRFKVDLEEDKPH